MQRKSIPLIKGADDDSGTFTGLASVFDNLDYDGDICSSRCLQQVTRLAAHADIAGVDAEA